MDPCPCAPVDVVDPHPDRADALRVLLAASFSMRGHRPGGGVKMRVAEGVGPHEVEGDAMTTVATRGDEQGTGAE
ncbi:hypothetical protein MOPEL_002_00020 [Mobilicoccus pelagius NBRC 104925]|uniref:Uncharacterized protein n=1 Tax=Mobilicoccus pelagius NBRC 104925 TaxID=1089455 RepID=H5UML1_9MICO|nr:hypothetical protein MOPEL_002_00020 [Mobilicoccus pelagius NBRC 104925]